MLRMQSGLFYLLSVVSVLARARPQPRHSGGRTVHCRHEDQLGAASSAGRSITALGTTCRFVDILTKCDLNVHLLISLLRVVTRRTILFQAQTRAGMVGEDDILAESKRIDFA